MPTFASGSYPAMPAPVQGTEGTQTDASVQNAQMQETLAGLQTAVAALTRRLDHPINATMDAYSSN